MHLKRDRLLLEAGKYWVSKPVLLILPDTGYKHPCYAFFSGPFMVPFSCDCIITVDDTVINRVTGFNFGDFSIANNQLWDNLIIKSTAPTLRYDRHVNRLTDVAHRNTSWLAGILNQSRQHLIKQKKR